MRKRQGRKIIYGFLSLLLAGTLSITGFATEQIDNQIDQQREQIEQTEQELDEQEEKQKKLEQAKAVQQYFRTD